MGNQNRSKLKDNLFIVNSHKRKKSSFRQIQIISKEITLNTLHYYSKKNKKKKKKKKKN